MWKNGQVREAGPIRSEEEKTRFDKNSIVWWSWWFGQDFDDVDDFGGDVDYFL